MDTTNTTGQKERWMSLDAMRGLVMISIIGLGHLITKLFLYSESEGWRKVWNTLNMQMQHAKWHGLTFFDIILPLFIFVSGMTLGVANRSLIGKPFKEKLSPTLKAVKRLIILIMLGLVFNHASGAYWPDSLENMRCASVLGMIGFAWFVAAMLTWHSTNRMIIIVALLIAVLIPSLRFIIHVPDHGEWQFTPAGSLNALVDTVLLPGATYSNGYSDPEGILSIIASVVMALCGVLAGKWLANKQTAPVLRISGLVAAGSVFMACGWLLDFAIPINKYLWTMSYVIVSTGCCAIIAALFHYLFDVVKLRWLSLPFVAVGANCILIYMLFKLVSWPHIAKSILGWSLPIYTDRFQPVAMSFYILMLQILLAVWLYQRRIFIKA